MTWDNADSETIGQDPLEEGDFGHSAPKIDVGEDWLDGNEYFVPHRKMDRVEEVSSASDAIKVEMIGDEPIEEEPFNVALMRESLGSISNASDCEITAEYQVDYVDAN